MKVTRAVLEDVHDKGDCSTVMVDEQVLDLSEIATSILRTVPAGVVMSIADVTAAVIETHGTPEPPSDAETLVRRQVLDLAAHGVLVVVDDGAPGTAPTTSRYGTLTPEALDAVAQALRAATAPSGRRAWELPSHVSESDFLVAVQRHRVVSQLALALHTLDVSESLAAGLSALHAGLAAASEGVTRDLLHVLATLSDADVRVMVFKGQALAAQTWGDATARGYGDIDLLVAPTDLATAYAALTDAGWRTDHLYPTPGPSWGWRQFMRTEYEMALSRGRSAVDLHWQPVPDRGAFPDFDTLWERRAEVALAGRTVPTFGPYDALAHSASHSTKDHWRWLRGLADIHRLTSDRDTWLAADRPLAGDQLLSVGIAASLFGVPDTAPRVVHDAASRCRPVLPYVRRVQLAPERRASHEWTPGLGTLQMLRPLWHARARPREFGRRLSTSALPPWALAADGSSRAYVAAPKALSLRVSEVRQRLRERP